MNNNNAYKTRLLSHCDINRRPGDGEFVFWLQSGSCLSGDDLRIIADRIDELNIQDGDTNYEHEYQKVLQTNAIVAQTIAMGGTLKAAIVTLNAAYQHLLTAITTGEINRPIVFKVSQEEYTMYKELNG